MTRPIAERLQGLVDDEQWVPHEMAREAIAYVTQLTLLLREARCQLAPSPLWVPMMDRKGLLAQIEALLQPSK